MELKKVDLPRPKKAVRGQGSGIVGSGEVVVGEVVGAAVVAGGAVVGGVVAGGSVGVGVAGGAAVGVDLGTVAGEDFTVVVVRLREPDAVVEVVVVVEAAAVDSGTSGADGALVTAIAVVVT